MVLTELEKAERWLFDAISKAVDDWFVKQNIYLEYHLYYKQGDILISNESPEGYTLASKTRISPAWTVEKARYFCNEVLRKCPCLPN